MNSIKLAEENVRASVLKKLLYLSVLNCCKLVIGAGVLLLFNGFLALLFSLFHVTRKFDRFLHRGKPTSGLSNLN